MTVKDDCQSRGIVMYQFFVSANAPPPGKPKWTRPRKVKLCVSIGPRSLTDPQPVLTVYYPEQR